MCLVWWVANTLVVRRCANQTTILCYTTMRRLRREERTDRNKVEGGVASNAPTKATRRRVKVTPRGAACGKREALRWTAWISKTWGEEEVEHGKKGGSGRRMTCG